MSSHTNRRLQILAATLLMVPLTWVAPRADAARPRSVREALVTYRMSAKPLATVDGVVVGGDGFGSGVAPVPGKRDEFYGLSDRGPNGEGPTPDSKIFPVLDYHPAIGRFRL